MAGNIAQVEPVVIDNHADQGIMIAHLALPGLRYFEKRRKRVS
jgi:hypothetical protein